MLRKPVPVTKNSLLKAVQTQRKSKQGIKWIVLGLMREGVPPTALILEESLLTEKKWYQPKEYDVIERIQDYDTFIDMYQLKNQVAVVEYLYNKSIGWQAMRREEYRKVMQSPIKTLTSKYPLTVYEDHFHYGNRKLNGYIHSYDNIRQFDVDEMLWELKNYKQYTEEFSQEDGTIGKLLEDKVRYTYQIEVVSGYNKEVHINLFEIEAPVTEDGIDYKNLKFNWKLREGRFGLKGDSYKYDPVYHEIQRLKEGK